MKTRILILLETATTALASIGQENIVNNGGFEQGHRGWDYTYNWAVWSGFPNAPDGRNWGEVYGTLFQDLTTTPGQQYHLRFALAGNRNVPDLATIGVFWGGNNIGAVSWNPSGHTDIGSLGWVWSEFDVTATTTTTRLTFANPYVGDGSGRIGFLDAISVVAVPEPSGLLPLALGSLVLLKRHRRSGA